MYIGDVGQNLYEEVDVQPASSDGGENYGWNLMEGSHCYQAGLRYERPDAAGDRVYARPGNCSVTGGYVYRGATVSRARRHVLLSATTAAGRMWTLKKTGGAWQTALAVASGFSISTFGQDDAGELYVADQGKGDIYQIQGPAGPGSWASRPS